MRVRESRNGGDEEKPGSPPVDAARAAKSKHEALYKPLEAVLVRAPLLPIEAYRDPSWPTPRKAWKDAAMAVGSLSLTEALGTERAAAPHLRYAIRMATRPTPYGLFSGVALGRWGDATTLAQANSPPITRTRPDMAWLIRLVTELEKRPDVRRRLAVRANTAAFIRGGRILISEASTPTGDGVAPPRVSVRATRAGARRCDWRASRFRSQTSSPPYPPRPRRSTRSESKGSFPS